MDDNRVNLIVSNDREWRKHILRELDTIKKSQFESTLKVNTLEVKMSIIAFVAGGVASALFKFLAA